MENDEYLVQQPGLPLPLKCATTILSSYSVSTGKEIHKTHTFIVTKGSRDFFPFTYNVALNYIAGGDDGCLYIMDALLILLVEGLKLVLSYVKMH